MQARQRTHYILEEAMMGNVSGREHPQDGTEKARSGDRNGKTPVYLNRGHHRFSPKGNFMIGGSRLEILRNDQLPHIFGPAYAVQCGRKGYLDRRSGGHGRSEKDGSE